MYPVKGSPGPRPGAVADSKMSSPGSPHKGSHGARSVAVGDHKGGSTSASSLGQGPDPAAPARTGPGRSAAVPPAATEGARVLAEVQQGLPHAWSRLAADVHDLASRAYLADVDPSARRDAELIGVFRQRGEAVHLQLDRFRQGFTRGSAMLLQPGWKHHAPEGREADWLKLRQTAFQVSVLLKEAIPLGRALRETGADAARVASTCTYNPQVFARSVVPKDELLPLAEALQELGGLAESLQAQLGALGLGGGTGAKGLAE